MGLAHPADRRQRSPTPAEADDLINILIGDRDDRFNTGLDTILTGLVRTSPAPSTRSNH
jgi:hypothetical protein